MARVCRSCSRHPRTLVRLGAARKVCDCKIPQMSVFGLLTLMLMLTWKHPSFHWDSFSFWPFHAPSPAEPRWWFLLRLHRAFRRRLLRPVWRPKRLPGPECTWRRPMKGGPRPLGQPYTTLPDRRTRFHLDMFLPRGPTSDREAQSTRCLIGGPVLPEIEESHPSSVHTIRER